MTYEQLRVLQAIVTEGTFRGAAAKLFKSQPAISNMIRKLEQECDLKLLSRDQYRPELTPEGQVFYEKALQALNQMNQLAALSKHMAKKEELLVRIAVNAVCPLNLLLTTLKCFEETYPATQLDVSTESMGGAIERLSDNDADIVITTQTGMEPSLMEAVPFRVVRILQIAHRDYPPAAHGGINSAADMRSYIQMIVADSSLHRTSQSLDVLQGARHWRVTDFAANKEIILSGMAWGAMPEHLIRDELESGELVPLHIEGIEPRLSQLYMMRRTDRSIGVVCDAIWQALQEIQE